MTRQPSVSSCGLSVHFVRLAAPHPLQDVTFLIGSTGGNQLHDGSADNFSGSVAKNPFRAAGPTGDDTFEILSRFNMDRLDEVSLTGLNSPPVLPTISS